MQSNVVLHFLLRRIIFTKIYAMKGISYITDDNNKKKAVVIDLKNIEKNEEEIHEFIDVLIAESRKNDELIDWEVAKKRLNKKGKL
jgi:hypothetical protein